MGSKVDRLRRVVVLLTCIMFSVLVWALIIWALLGLFAPANAMETATCETVIAEVEGVYWRWPNTWTGGPVCYSGERDERQAIVTITREVTIKGSASALRKLGLIE